MSSQAGELSDALRHVQRRQHLLENGSLHVGAPQVGLLQVAAGQVAVLQTGAGRGSEEEAAALADASRC